MPTTRQVLETTIALERGSMALYVCFARLFASDPKLKEFWFSMARDEARHVGALDLVSTVLEQEGRLDEESPVALEESTVSRLGDLIDRYRQPEVAPIPIGRALQIAVEVEESELEDMVGDLLRVMQAPDEYERCLRLLVHDLGELSYMIEQHCRDPELLERCDRLVNRHAETLRRTAADTR